MCQPCVFTRLRYYAGYTAGTAASGNTAVDMSLASGECSRHEGNVASDGRLRQAASGGDCPLFRSSLSVR